MKHDNRPRGVSHPAAIPSRTRCESPLLPSVDRESVSTSLTGLSKIKAAVVASDDSPLPQVPALQRISVSTAGTLLGSAGASGRDSPRLRNAMTRSASTLCSSPRNFRRAMLKSDNGGSNLSLADLLNKDSDEDSYDDSKKRGTNTQAHARSMLAKMCSTSLPVKAGMATSAASYQAAAAVDLLGMEAKRELLAKDRVFKNIMSLNRFKQKESEVAVAMDRVCRSVEILEILKQGKMFRKATGGAVTITMDSFMTMQQKPANMLLNLAIPAWFKELKIVSFVDFCSIYFPNCPEDTYRWMGWICFPEEMQSMDEEETKNCELTETQSKEARMLFKSYDLNHSGGVSLKELIIGLGKLGFSAKEVQKLFSEHAEDTQQELCFEQFSRIVQHVYYR